jgi:transcriptional regulator with XRE-family HTH domain
MDLEGFEKEGYIQRLRLLRLLHGKSPTEFAEFLGVGYKKWTHYELGYHISPETAFRLRKRVKLFSFSLDWLYWGDTHGIPPGVLQQMKVLQRELGPKRQKADPRSRTAVRRYVKKTDKV